MQITRNKISDTKIKLTLEADQEQLQTAKDATLKAAAKDLKLPGFRQGKVPMELVEKNANPSVLQQDFMEQALNAMYAQALDDEKIRPVAQPSVAVKKFVPFSELEADVEVEVIGDVTLADYKKLVVKKEAVSVAAKEVNEVIEQLRLREAERTDVERAAKSGDQVVIDFIGTDAKTKEAIAGADGKAYPLVLGSDSFIPGFEPELIGMKAGEDKTFDITFPEDYSVSALQKRKVTFAVTVSKVQEVTKPKLDDSLAEKLGPFKKLAELKEDIKKQLVTEKEQQAARAFEEQVLNAVTDGSKIDIPDVLIDAELDRMDTSERQDLAYRGQTWTEHLAAEGVTEEEHRDRNRVQAERRVKAGLVLAEVADKEQITVSKDDLDVRLQLYKQQYQDAAMQSELDKPENQREIISRLLTEKTLAKLGEYMQRAN